MTTGAEKRCGNKGRYCSFACSMMEETLSMFKSQRKDPVEREALMRQETEKIRKDGEWIVR